MTAVPFRDGFGARRGDPGFAGGEVRPLPARRFHFLGRNDSGHGFRFGRGNAKLPYRFTREAGGGGQLAADNREQSGGAVGHVVVDDVSAGYGGGLPSRTRRRRRDP